MHTVIEIVEKTLLRIVIFKKRYCYVSPPAKKNKWGKRGYELISPIF
jgi:hypothetical protein